MDNRTSSFIKALFRAIQAVRFYPPGHPSSAEALRTLHGELSGILQETERFSFAMHDHELISKDDILHDEHEQYTGHIDRLEKMGIEKLSFAHGLGMDELTRFVTLLCNWNPDELPSIQLQNAGISHITAARLQDGHENDDSGQARDEFLVREYGTTLEKLGLVINSLLDDDVVNLLGMKYVLNAIMNNLSDSYHLFLLLAQVKEFDDSTYLHSLNVSILAMNFANHLHISPANSREIGTAGFLHDMGKMYMDRRILNKPGKLDDKEMGHIKDHARLGAQIILKHVEDIGRLPAIVAFEHHLRHDMTGYPKVTHVTGQHIATGIVCLCDVYDALTQKRSYKEEMGAAKVYEIMKSDRGTLFAPDLFDEFFRHFGIWPRGSVVRLADGRIAVVHEENADDIVHPMVDIVDGGRHEAVNLALDGTDIVGALDPRTDGKRYLDLPLHTITQ